MSHSLKLIYCLFVLKNQQQQKLLLQGNKYVIYLLSPHLRSLLLFVKVNLYITLNTVVFGGIAVDIIFHKYHIITLDFLSELLQS